MTFNGKAVLGVFFLCLWVGLTALSLSLSSAPPDLPLVVAGVTGGLFGLPGLVLVALSRRGFIKQDVSTRVGKRFSPGTFGIGLAFALCGVALVVVGVSGVSLGGVTLRVLPVFGVLATFGGLVGAARAFALVCRRCDVPLEACRLALPARHPQLERGIRVNDVPLVASALTESTRVSETDAAFGPRGDRVYGDVLWCATCRIVAHLRFRDTARWFLDKEAIPIVEAITKRA
jgi:hypothetical protein